jgi:hypothetical protein
MVERFGPSQVDDLGLDDAGSGVSTAEEGATTDDDNNCEDGHNSDEGYEDATLNDTDVNSSSKPKKVLVFTTLTLLGLLAMCRNGSVDGTFKSMTKMFKQLFIMMVKYEGPFVPIAFGWLPNKHTVSYHIYLLLLLKFRLENKAVFEIFGRSKLRLKKITLDFEFAIDKAFGCIFKLRGCFFHYSQAGWCVVQKEGMVVNYISVEEFRDFVLSVIAIAIALNLIEGVIDELRAKVFHSSFQCVKKLTSFQATFLNYIETVWLYGNFQPKMWNQWKRTKNLTNNNNEGMAISSCIIFY